MISPLFKLFFVLLLFGLVNQVLAEDDSNFRLRAHQADLAGDTEEDVKAEIQFGQNIAARILGQFPLYRDEELNRYVNLVGKSLASNSARDDISFHFAVLDADFVNAYSAPGGYVFITKGAIKLMQDEAELAAVLAHEVAHIADKHIVKEFKIKGTDTSATAGLSQLLGSSTSSAKAAFSQAVDNAVNLLMDKGFKQDDELESDRDALLLLAATGYDPTALNRFLNRIKQQTDKEQAESKHKPTHPPTDARINALKQLMEKENLAEMGLPTVKSRFSRYVIQ